MEEDTSLPTLPPPKNNLAVPASIIAAGFLIALAIIYTGKADNGNMRGNKAAALVQDSASVTNMKPVSAADHIMGNPSAPVKIVEYSDLECPFCKRFHFTMKQIMDEYGKSGQVAWVYRQFPLEALHSKARHEAEASECAAKLGGNDKFWAFIDRVFEITPSNNGLDTSLLPEIAKYVGLNQQDFQKCLTSGEFKKSIDESIADAAAAGAEGTPYSILIGADGEQVVINGSQPYEIVKQAVDSYLSKN